jgi:hypothetical protein
VLSTATSLECWPRHSTSKDKTRRCVLPKVSGMESQLEISVQEANQPILRRQLRMDTIKIKIEGYDFEEVASQLVQLSEKDKAVMIQVNPPSIEQCIIRITIIIKNRHEHKTDLIPRFWKDISISGF